MRWTRGNTLYEYEPTDEDRLVLARAVAHEGRPQRGVAWTLVQRFALLHPKYYQTLADFVRAYSQPINPRWFPDGDLHQAAVARAGHNQARIADLERRADRRLQFAQEGWDELDPEAREAALEALEAPHESPYPGALHFIAAQTGGRKTRAQAYARAQAFAAARSDLSAVVPTGADGYGEKGPVNWLFTGPASSSLRILPAGEAPILDDEPPVPIGPPPKSPPPGAPKGSCWGWVYCYLPSLPTLQAANAQGEQATEESSPPSDPPKDAESAPSSSSSKRRRARANGASVS